MNKYLSKIALLVTLALAGCYSAQAATTTAQTVTWTNPSGAVFPDSQTCFHSAPLVAPTPTPMQFTCTGKTVVTAVSTTTTTSSITIPGAPTTAPVIALSNLPANPAATGTASINWTAAPAGTAVYCRLDSYAVPTTPCPNPFVLGATAAQVLAAGAHEVDFYLSPTQATPTIKYNWVVSGTVVTPPPVIIPPPVTGGGAPILMTSLNAQTPFAQDGAAYVQILGGSQNLVNVSETAGITGSCGSITGPNGPTNMRFGKIADPVTPTRQVFFYAAMACDGVTYDHLGRVETGPDDNAGAMADNVAYWVANEVYVPANTMAQGDQTFWQIHNSYAPSIVFGPVSLMGQGGDIYPNVGATIATAWSTQSDPSKPGYNSQGFYPWGSNNPGFPAVAANYNTVQTFGNYPTGTWVKTVCEFKTAPTTQTGFVYCWLTTAAGVTTQIVNVSNIQLGTDGAANGSPNYYAKMGIDAFSTGGGTTGAWELHRSFYIYKDNGNTEPQIRALMK